MLKTYMQQLEELAEAAGVTLDDACHAEGIPRTTLWRWRNERTTPSEAVAGKLARRITQIAASRPTPNQAAE